MRLLVLAIGPIAAALVFVACGGQVSQTQTSSTGGSGGQTSSSSSSSTSTSSSGTSTSSSSTSSSTSSSSGGGTHGDCQADTDCPGGPCVSLTPGGYKVCLSFPMEATACDMPGGGNECCTSADCAGAGGGSCYAAIDLQFCGGAFPAFNQCVADGCTQDADCGAQGVCAPAGAFGFPKRFCLTAYCHVDADCNAKPGGICALVGEDPCCSHPAPDGLGCVYPGGCEKDAACPGGACDLDPATGTSGCGPAGPGCPP